MISKSSKIPAISEIQIITMVKCFAGLAKWLSVSFKMKDCGLDAVGSNRITVTYNIQNFNFCVMISILRRTLTSVAYRSNLFVGKFSVISENK